FPRPITRFWRYLARGGMPDDGDPIRHRLELWRDLLDQLARPLIGLLAPFRKHRSSVLIHDLDIETIFGFLEHNVLRCFGDFRHVLQALPQRRGRKRKFAVLLEAGAVAALPVTVL